MIMQIYTKLMKYKFIKRMLIQIANSQKLALCRQPIVKGFIIDVYGNTGNLLNIEPILEETCIKVTKR